MTDTRASEPHIVLDIGNSLTKIALFRETQIVSLETTPTSDVDITFNAIIKMDGKNTLRIVIASVVPTASKDLSDLISRYRGQRPFNIETTTNIPIAIEYETPHTLGIDRICNAVAASAYMSFPCAVVDFGTAITIDVISKEGSFIGGAILPGLHALQRALLADTAQLPQVPLQFPLKSIGYDTATCLQSGIMFGLVEMIDGLITRMNSEIEGDFLEIVATGGFAEEIAPLSAKINRVQKHLTLEGASLIYNYNLKLK